ncbi:MAG: hypothetical protein GY757_34285, partial [bacterium]|nr:hypothetical protein [bacterium]
KYLCAYIVPKTPGPIGIAGESGLKKYLSQSLPDYMIPGYFVSLESLPLTPNGKLDRRSLPLPQLDASRHYIAPRNRIEETMVQIWSEVLELDKEKISINDNFFELGGHSLKAVVLISKLHPAFNVKVPLVELFQNPTISGVTLYIKNASRETFISIEPAEKKEYYDLSPAQQRMYILQQMEPGNIVYNIPEIIPIGASGIEKEHLANTFRKLIERHESLRTSFCMQEEKSVQRVHETVQLELKIECFQITKENSPGIENGEQGEKKTHRSPLFPIIKEFVRPFD